MAKSKLWFKAKQYGWGWYPSTLEGWLILLEFFLVEITSFLMIYYNNSYSINDTLVTFIPLSIIFSGILILFCYLTGEKPKWRWGNKK